MNKNNLTKLATYTAVLFAFLFAGCTQLGSSGTMDDSMDTMMEQNVNDMNTPEMNGSMEKMDEPMMEEPMNEMNEQNMDNTMDTMNTGTTDDKMMGTEEKMGPEQDKMMK